MNKDAVAEISQQYQVEAAKKLVPEGYKQTEVGVIPEDWVVQEIGKIAPLQRGFDLPAQKRRAGNYPVVYSNGIVNSHNEFQVKGPGVVTGRSGTLGKVHYIEGEYWPHNTTLWVTRFNNTDPKFVYFLFRYIGLERFASGSGVPTLNRNDAHSFRVNIPNSMAEQTAIANALSDTDVLLSELEKLIAKKQAIKTATMQQLLTGRTRLPQFANHPDGSKKGYKQSELGEIPEDWGICNLSDFVLTLESGVSVNSIEQSDAFSHGKHVLKTSCVEKGYFYGNEKKSILPNDLKRAKCTPKTGCIIVSRMNTPSLVGEIGYVEKDCSSSFLPDRLWQIIFKKDVEVNTRWLAYFLSFPDISGKIKEAATGTSGSMKNISKGSFLSLALSTPNLEEQTAIATILSDMDEEIQALEQRLTKTRQIKQGMMQQLLTGKIRLEKPINEEPEHD